jgi:hypothetical protein
VEITTIRPDEDANLGLDVIEPNIDVLVAELSG